MPQSWNGHLRRGRHEAMAAGPVHPCHDKLYGLGQHLPNEAAGDLVRTFTEQLEQVVGGLPVRSAGMSEQ